MMIDLTYKCSMGCSHCMSDCNKNGEEMSLETLRDVCKFIKDNRIDTVMPFILGISGGEIFEHSQILDCLDILFETFGKKINVGFMLSSNGRILADTPEYLEYLKNAKNKYGKQKIMLQITDDERFYPTKLTQKQRYNLEKIGGFIQTVPTTQQNRNKCLYPQGRALHNFDESYWNVVSTKCANCRLMTMQGVLTFKDLVQKFTDAVRNCTPCISPKGEIKLGESALCPPVATIYDSEKEIFDKIRNFYCNDCHEAIKIFKENDLIFGSILFPE